MPFETYSALLNLKKIIPSAKSSFIAVDRDYLIALFYEKINEVDVDSSWYLEKYVDVRNACKAGLVESAADHYCRFGYFEHRMPYLIQVDSRWYLSEYRDVKEALDQEAFASAQDHFEQLGFQEGRHPYAGFALRKRDEPEVRNSSQKSANVAMMPSSGGAAVERLHKN